MGLSDLTIKNNVFQMLLGHDYTEKVFIRNFKFNQAGILYFNWDILYFNWQPSLKRPFGYVYESFGFPCPRGNSPFFILSPMPQRTQ